MNWIVQNSNWFFDGIGASIFSVIIIFLTWIAKKLISVAGSLKRIEQKITLVELNDFIDIEKKASKEVWIISFGYCHEKMPYVRNGKIYNLRRGILYKYFIQARTQEEFMSFFKLIRNENKTLLEHLEAYILKYSPASSVIVIDPDSHSLCQVFLLLEESHAGGSLFRYVKIDEAQAQTFLNSFRGNMGKSNLMTKVDMETEMAKP